MYIRVSGISGQHMKKPAENRFDCCFCQPGENLALVEQRDDKARPIHPSDHERRKKCADAFGVSGELK